MNEYPAHKFLNGLNGLKRGVKRPKAIRASTSKTDENNEKLILHESFNMRKVCAKMMPKLLPPEQKESRMNTYADILNKINTDPGLLDTVITCDDKIRKYGSG
ncbi:hypothetical protein NQ318_001113 [Aromia moschata]|uniref:Uncharacterized protein n=1 Tax=Aromia moschata TaxID=1265417 RepID=A0AAV8ZEH2_9CUCU|nr:hypothetical protein NQ318_001113 [Aromia moschata]